MDKIVSFHWRTDDGEDRWSSAWIRESCRGVLVCVHGLSGAGEQFKPLADEFEDFSVYTLDLRGQGLDPQVHRRGMLLDVSQQHRDITSFLKAVNEHHPANPLFLVGESMGALLVMSYVASHPYKEEICGTVLSVPVVALTKPVPLYIKRLVKVLGRVFPKVRLNPAWFVTRNAQPLPLTRDKAYQDALNQQPYRLREFALRFFSDLGDLIDSSNALAKELKKPCLVLAAGQDCFVRASQVEAWFEHIASSDKSLCIYEDAYHLLWHDWSRDRVLADIKMWLNQRLA